MHRPVDSDPPSLHLEPQDGDPGGCPCICACTCSCGLGDQAATQPSRSSLLYGGVANDVLSTVPHVPGS